ncbi:MAG: DEAD/DEAH box helicase [Candidatus Omnitrophota bacterium]|jgi:ATP-dependent exoDNAse (exonuclease V) alpha subunit
MPDIELNDRFKEALAVMGDTRRNVFITGKAGTGKSTLLTHFRSITGKRIVVLAPTGVAAVNIRGETIHSFFGFKPDITLQKVKKLKNKRERIFRELDAIVIDEVSMVRADLLDCVDYFMRLNGRDRDTPFGGAQMIFIGDLYQLPPVVTAREKEIFSGHYKSAYFFDARVFEDGFSMEFIELEKIYRQKDEKFIGLLNAVRNNTLSEGYLSLLNSRAGKPCGSEETSGYTVYLTSTNQMAAQINDERLVKVQGEIRPYPAEINGDFDERSYPADKELRLCEGAQVMLLNNDSKGRWVNGTLGEVSHITYSTKKEADEISVFLPDGSLAEILPHTWEIFHFRFNEETLSIESESAGSFTQYPLKLAWAVTIHKSQGKTFDRVIIDTGKGAFAHGQVYVALSRCTSFEGISLKKPLRAWEIRMDRRIEDFLKEMGEGRQNYVGTAHCAVPTNYSVSMKTVPLS